MRSTVVHAMDYFFSELVRMKRCNSMLQTTCVTCWKSARRTKHQNWHFLSRRFLLYRWSMQNCYPQCVACNVFLNGNYIKYTSFMQRIVFKWDTKKFDKFCLLAEEPLSLSLYELKEMLLGIYSDWLEMSKKVKRWWKGVVRSHVLTAKRVYEELRWE